MVNRSTCGAAASRCRYLFTAESEAEAEVWHEMLCATRMQLILGGNQQRWTVVWYIYIYTYIHRMLRGRLSQQDIWILSTYETVVQRFFCRIATSGFPASQCVDGMTVTRDVVDDPRKVILLSPRKGGFRRFLHKPS